MQKLFAAGNGGRFAPGRIATLLCITAAALVAAVGARPAFALTVVEQGEPAAALVLPIDAAEGERLAAEELQEHIRLITGATLPITTSDDEPFDGLKPIRIGTAADDGLEHALAGETDDSAAFVLVVTSEAAGLRGLTDEGARNAAYELLEQIGVRWYMPGDFARVLPEATDTLTLPEGRTLGVPSLEVRGLANWVERNFPRWSQRMRNSRTIVSPRHGIMPYRISSQRRQGFEENPEFFRLRDGERAAGQLCISNPDLFERVVETVREYFRENPDREYVGLGPNDGSGYCECDDCRALDGGVKTALTNRISITDRYFWFYNRVLEAIEDEFPDKRIATLLYADQMDPPVRVTPDARIIGVIAVIHACRIHHAGNPNCPEASYRIWLTEQWQEHLDTIVHSGYWFNLACPGLPFMMMHRMRAEIPLLHEMGTTGIRRSTGINWATEGPSLYVAAKLMWDVETDVDALLAEFFDRFYGPAAAPMRKYTMLLDRAAAEADRHTGSSWDLLHIYDTSVRERARAAIDEAQRLAERANGDGQHAIYATRVRVAADGWAYFEAFAEMMERRDEHEYVQAMRALERIDAIQHRLLNDYEIEMLRDWTAERFLRAFFRRATEEAYERVTNGNQFVAGLSDRWQFLLEPQGIGERIGLHDPAYTGGNWQPITTRQTWSNHGLRYYWGEAWYRQTIDLPDDLAEQRIRLWFAGVHNGAKVFVNGEPVGTSPGTVFDLAAHGGSAAPFEFDVTDVIRPGEPNTVSVRVIRDHISELGTGGLLGPAMFYAAAEDDDENSEGDAASK